MIEHVKGFLKKYWKTLVFYGIAGIIGGYFIGIYQLDAYPEEIRQQIYDQGLNDFTLGLVTAMQAVGYGVILGAIGLFLGEKIGLVDREEKAGLCGFVSAVTVAAFGGIALIVPDLLVFGKYSEAIMNSYAAKPTVDYIIGAVIYGGVIEEVMIRLFLMTLIAFIINFIVGNRGYEPSTATLVVANVISALVFAAAHLPATSLLLGITPVILIRCFLLNGGIGLLFGWLYRKYGIGCAMVAHAGCHVVSKLIWILFI